MKTKMAKWLESKPIKVQLLIQFFLNFSITLIIFPLFDYFIWQDPKGLKYYLVFGIYMGIIMTLTTQWKKVKSILKSTQKKDLED